MSTPVATDDNLGWLNRDNRNGHVRLHNVPDNVRKAILADSGRSVKPDQPNAKLLHNK